MKIPNRHQIGVRKNRLSPILSKIAFLHTVSKPIRIGLLFVAVSLLAALAIKLTMVNPTAAAWFNDNWSFRTKITFGNTGSADSDKKVKLDLDTASLISAGKLQSDCGDTRLTDTNGIVLQYYLDTAGGACNTASTDYYVLVPTIGVGTTTLYHYYGNPNIENGTNSSQFTESTFSPNSGPTLASEEFTPGPAAYWKFDEGTGTTTYDSSTNKINGTLGTGSSAPTWNTSDECISEKCLNFDGSNDYVSIGGTAPIVNSISFWVKTNTTTDEFVELNGSANVTASSGTVSTSGITSPTIYVNGKVSSTIVASEWSHVMVTTATAVTASNIKVGRVGTSTLNGRMDEFKLYPYARNSSQVKQDFASRGSVHGVSAQIGGSDMPSKLQEGLIGWWKMDENTGTTTADGSGAGNTGTLGTGSSAPTWSGGRFGSGLSFDGGDKVNFTSFAPVTGGNPRTISAWIYATANDGTILSWGSNSTGQSNTFAINGNGKIYFVIGNGQISDTDGTSVQNSWNHVVVTCSGNTLSTCSLWKNGQLAQTSTNTTTINTSSATSLKFGYPISGSSSVLKGILDDVRIYNRALSPAEVEALYNYAPGPVGYWKMDENTGTTAVDSSGLDNSATLTNTPTWTTGKYGSGIAFAGSDQHVTRADDSDFDFADDADMALTTWFKHSTASAQEIILSKYNEAGYKIIMESDGDITCALDYDSAWTPTDSASSTAATYDDGNWHYIACVKSGAASLSLYIDGVLIATDSSLTATNTLTNSDPIYFGIDADGTSNDFTGSLDDVKIYNYARTSSQVIEDMNGGHPVGGSPVGSAVGYWKLDDMQGTTAQDSSTATNDNDLTLSSTSWTNSGKFNAAWNGTGSVWLSRVDDADFDFSATEDLSISGWFKSDSATNPAAVEYLINKASATVAGYAVYANTSGNLCFGIDDDTTWGPNIASCTTSDVYDNTWHHFLGIRDYSSTDKTYIYIDGIQRDSDSDSTTATLANSLLLYVGDRDGIDNGDEFAGDIDEVKVYRAALTQAQVLTEKNAGKAIVLGSLSTGAGGSAPSYAQDRSYCIPGDSTSCSPPVGEWKMNEGSGTSSVNDTSGNNYTGTLTGMTSSSWVPGKFGSALQFDGTDDYVTMTTEDGNFSTSAYTNSVWIYRKTDSGGIESILDNRDALDDGTNVLITSTDALRCRHNTANPTTFDLSLNTWYHVACVWNGSTVRMYVNGAEFSNSAIATSLAETTDMRIGARSFTSATNFFPGIIDDVKIYNYARTAAQVAWEYNQGAPVAWYKMDECQGTTINDWGPNANGGYNGNNLTLTIAATGTNDAPGTCSSGDTSEAWANGATGKINSSISLDGTDDYIPGTDPSSGILDFVNGEDFTLAFWANIPDRAASDAIVAKKNGNGAGGTGYMLNIFADETIGLYTADGTDQNLSTSTTSLPASTWTHVTVVYDDDTEVRIYFNGKQQSVSSGQSAISTVDSLATAEKFTIGAESDAQLFLQGQIDDFRVYRYALTPNQIKEVMNNGAVSFR